MEDSYFEYIILPRLILPILRGDAGRIPNTRMAMLVKCEGIDICRCAAGQIFAVACDHPCHEAHPRFANKFEKINQIMQKLSPRKEDDSELDICPKCRCPKGMRGWLPPNTPEAFHTVLMAAVFGMYRGIILPEKSRAEMLERLNVADTNVILSEFLSDGHKPSDASPGPADTPFRRSGLSFKKTKILDIETLAEVFDEALAIGEVKVISWNLNV